MVEGNMFIADEHPEGDKYQLVMLVLFLTIWVADSFIIKMTLIDSLVAWYLRASFGILILLVGAYLVNESHKLVINADESFLVDYGVYSLTRHPMYLGIC